MSDTAKGKALVEGAKDRAVDVRHDLLLALKRIEEGKAQRVKIRPRQKITPAMVAREAERARSQLYATHRDVLGRISEANAKRNLAESESKKGQRRAESELRELIVRLSRDKELLAQHNFRLQCEVDELKADIASRATVGRSATRATKKEENTRRD